MLADAEALQMVIGTNVHPEELGLPRHPRQVESISDPKAMLNRVVQHALAMRRKRRRRINVATIYEPLARQIDLSSLQQVPAYRQFVDDLTAMLIELRVCE